MRVGCHSFQVLKKLDDVVHQELERLESRDGPAVSTSEVQNRVLQITRREVRLLALSTMQENLQRSGKRAELFELKVENELFEKRGLAWIDWLHGMD